MNYTQIPNDSVISKTSDALKSHGFKVIIVDKGEKAKQEALKLIPVGAEVMTMTSVTNDSIGLSKELDKSGKYNAVRPKLMTMNKDTQESEMQKLGSAPVFSTGSVHAVTQDGHLLIASRSGSQLPAEVYGSKKVIFIVGAQKIVRDDKEGIERIYQYVLPLESERARKAYGVAGSSVSKLLILNDDVPERTTIIIVKEVLGF